MLVCGHCGYRARVGYHGTDGRYPGYVCGHLSAEGLAHRNCFAVSVRNIDPAVVQLVLGMLTAEHLDAATKVVEIIEQEDQAIEQQWKLRTERARYEAKRAERQYDACEPENRVVARTLEKRWNEKIEELERIEREHEQARRTKRQELTDIDRQRIRALANDLPRLWAAKTTTDRDRKLLLRILVKEIGLKAVDVPKRLLHVRLLWQSGAVTDIEIDRVGPGGGPPRRAEPLRWRIVETPSTVSPLA